MVKFPGVFDCIKGFFVKEPILGRTNSDLFQDSILPSTLRSNHTTVEITKSDKYKRDTAPEKPLVRILEDQTQRIASQGHSSNQYDKLPNKKIPLQANQKLSDTTPEYFESDTEEPPLINNSNTSENPSKFIHPLSPEWNKTNRRSIPLQDTQKRTEPPSSEQTKPANNTEPEPPIESGQSQTNKIDALSINCQQKTNAGNQTKNSLGISDNGYGKIIATVKKPDEGNQKDSNQTDKNEEGPPKPPKTYSLKETQTKNSLGISDNGYGKIIATVKKPDEGNQKDSNQTDKNEEGPPKPPRTYSLEETQTKNSLGISDNGYGKIIATVKKPDEDNQKDSNQTDKNEEGPPKPPKTYSLEETQTKNSLGISDNGYGKIIATVKKLDEGNQKDSNQTDKNEEGPPKPPRTYSLEGNQTKSSLGISDNGYGKKVNQPTQNTQQLEKNSKPFQQLEQAKKPSTQPSGHPRTLFKVARLANSGKGASNSNQGWRTYPETRKPSFNQPNQKGKQRPSSFNDKPNTTPGKSQEKKEDWIELARQRRAEDLRIRQAALEREWESDDSDDDLRLNMQRLIPQVIGGQTYVGGVQRI